MRQRKRRSFLLPVLFFLVGWCMPVIVHAEVKWNTLSTLDLDKSPIDLFTTPDNKLAYLLTPGEVRIYSLAAKTLQGRIPVDKDVSRISVSPKGDLLFLLNEKAKTVSLVSVGFFQTIDVKGSPFKGPADAPVVIVFFSDYQCPYCAQILPLLQPVLEHYPEDIKLIYKDFPTPGHPLGRPAAVAALAAGEQNKFWEYYDKIMQNTAQLSAQKFLDVATELGLDMDAFRKGLLNPDHEKHIDKDAQDAVKAGITGTPSMFVNGHLVTILIPDVIKAMVNDEVKKKKK